MDMGEYMWNIFLELIPEVILLAISGLFWLVWYKRRLFKNYFEKKIIHWFPQTQKITFSIKHNQELNSGIYYDEIKRVFAKNLEDYELSKAISHRDYSEIFLFGNIGEAIKFREKKNLDLVLWGGFSNDHLKIDGVHESEITLNFTYGFKHRKTNKDQIEKAINNRISQILAIKNHWKISEKNSLNDVGRVADTMFTTTVFTLGLTLTNQHRFNEALNIFNKLLKYLENRDDETSIRLNEYLVTCNEQLLAEVMKYKKADWHQANQIAGKILEASPNNLMGLIISAISYYKIGERDKSKNVTSKLMQAHPRSGSARINYAFLHILDGKYEHALRHYKKVIKGSRIDFGVVSTIDIVNQEYDLINEPALRFTTGFLNFYFDGDKVIARKDLEEFLELGTEEKYGAMYNEAKNMLASID
jgi:tetratricopeptide (TPR) repeat protein